MVKLFIGITTFNSSFFLPTCLSSIKRCFENIIDYKVCIVDNESNDTSRQIALSFNCDVIKKRCIQADALNILIGRSSGECTLLLHSDVALLSKEIWPLLKNIMHSHDVLVSPEDIGLGNYDRIKMGAGMPESSFMLWKTKEALSLRSLRIYNNYTLKSFVGRLFRSLPIYCLDFYGPHITHHIPKLLKLNGFNWVKMKVHPSTKLPEPWFINTDANVKWVENDWGYREYGFGNFYSIEGHITHYHNWFSREISDSVGHYKLDDCKVSVAYIKAYSERFKKDFEKDVVHLPVL